MSKMYKYDDLCSLSGAVMRNSKKKNKTKSHQANEKEV